jgi:hypothetical protein
MALTILDDTITSDRTAHAARLAPGERHLWEVSWLPGQYMNHNTAITAMTLAEAASPGGMHAGHRLWPHIQGWAAELGMTAPDAIAQAATPPGRPDTGKNAMPADPEAAG